MRIPIRTLRAGVASLFVMTWAVTAAAQSTVYVTGSAFADMKRFGTNSFYGPTDHYSLDGTSPGGGLRVGTFLNDRWTLELAVDAGGRSRVDASYRYVAILAAAFPVRYPKLTASTKFTAVSTILGYHPAPHARIRLGYMAGFSFIRGVYKTDYPYGVPGPLFTITTAELAATPIPAIYPPPPLTITTLTQTDNARGVILGFEAAIDVTKHFAVVPEVRALTFSAINNGPGVFLIRPGVGIRWGF